MSSPSRRSARVKPTFANRLCATAMVAAMTAVPTSAFAQATTGRWSPPESFPGVDDPNRYAIHMVLLPGDGNPYHSRILWWSVEKPLRLHGTQWGWNANDNDCLAFPSGFIDLGLPKSNVDIFCAGNVPLPDGRLLVPGGNDPVTGFFGEKKARIFTPGSGSIVGAWSDPGNMADWRWYPTATALREGRVLVTSGNKHHQHLLFGGKRDGVLPASPVGDSLYRFAPVKDGGWDLTVMPDADLLTSQRPAVREGHTAVDMRSVPGFERIVIFGGRDGTGPLQDTWFLRRDDNTTGADYRYQWEKRAPTDPPARRSEHTAVAALNSMMVVYGGLNSTTPPFQTCAGWSGIKVLTSGSR